LVKGAAIALQAAKPGVPCLIVIAVVVAANTHAIGLALAEVKAVDLVVRLAAE
jgi:hypothetical protein